jgi:hypothetical protein
MAKEGELKVPGITGEGKKSHENEAQEGLTANKHQTHNHGYILHPELELAVQCFPIQVPSWHSGLRKVL